MQRRAFLGTVAGVVGVAGCLSTGDPGTDGRQSTTDGPERDDQQSTTSDPRTDDRQPTTPRGPDRPPETVHLGLSKRYGASPPAGDERVEVRFSVLRYDYVTFGGDYYTVSMDDLSGSTTCAAVPSYSRIIGATETPLQPADFRDSDRPRSLAAFPQAAQELAESVLDADGDHLRLETWSGVESPKTPTRASDLRALFDGDRNRYVRIDGRVYLFEHRLDIRPSCAIGQTRPTVRFEPASGAPGPDDSVLETVALSQRAVELIDTVRTEWVRTGLESVPDAVRTLAASDAVVTPAGTLRLSLRQQADGYRLAAVRYPQQW